MATQVTPAITEFTLGLEEVALGLLLINYPAEAAALLALSYEDLTDEQADAILNIASNSMLARGLCYPADKGTMALAPGLEQALYPVADFDYLVRASVIDADDAIDYAVHVQRDGSFTATYERYEGVHVIEHGPTSALHTFLAGRLAAFAEGAAQPVAFPVRQGMMGEAIALGTDEDAIVGLLTDEGVAEDAAALLADDLAHQVMRGIIIRTDISSDTEAIDWETIDHPSLLLLRGPERCWLFEFHHTSDEAKGIARIISADAFRDALDRYVC